MPQERINLDPLFAPEWPVGEMSPTLAMLRLRYIDAHGPGGETLVSQASVVANRMMAFDRAMRREVTA